MGGVSERQENMANSDRKIISEGIFVSNIQLFGGPDDHVRHVSYLGDRSCIFDTKPRNPGISPQILQASPRSPLARTHNRRRTGRALFRILLGRCHTD